MPTPLDAWQHRLEAHFGELAASRSASGFPIFALEHGLNHAQLEEITELLRSELAAGERLYLHWLLWVIAFGYTRLQQVNILKSHVGLNDLFLAILIASKKLNVRLRPELKAGENFSAEDEVEQGIASGAGDTEPGLFSLILKMRSSLPPQALLEDIVTTVQDPFLGLEALALASICERNELTPKLEKLPPIPGLAETPEAKIGLARAWLRCWRNFGFWLAGMPSTWRNRSKAEGVSVKDKKGKGKFDAMDVVITDRAARKVFNDKWTPELLALFAVDLGGLINCAAANYRFNSMAHGRVVLLANPFTGPYLELRTALIAGVRKSLRSILTSIPHSWPGRAITAGR